MVSELQSQNGLLQCVNCSFTLDGSRLDGLCPACMWASLSEDGVDAPASNSAASSDSCLLRMPGYLVQEEISRGGIGIVYRAQQLDPRREVALKMLLPYNSSSVEMRERFRMEIRAISSLEHPSILPIYHAGEHDRIPFFAMKFAGGGTLATRAGEYAGDSRAIAGLMADVADAVQFAHERGVLHRDLKPANILFDKGGRAYVSDFGLAKLASANSDLTRSAEVFGTPHYMAPEVAASSARHAMAASDIYSLGAILYELMAQRPPFEAEGIPVLLKKIVEQEPPPLPKSVPRDLGVICFKCLAKEPSRRFASARELADDLRRWLTGMPIAARPVSRAERAWRWTRRNPSVAAIAVVLLLSLSAGGIALWQSSREVRNATAAAMNARLEAERNRRADLLAQAKALGSVHGIGQRWKAIELLSQAARIGPSVELRNEAAAALARPDLREILRFPAPIGEGGSTVVFSSDLSSYVAPEPSGGFAHRFTRNQTLLASFPSSSGKPARWFVLSPDDRHVAALLDDYSLEVWSLIDKRRLLRWTGNVAQPPVAEFHPDGASLAGFVPGPGLFLQGLDGTARRSLTSTKARAIFLRFNPSGDRLAVVRDPGGVELWRCTGVPKLIWTQVFRKTVPWIAWSPGGERLAVAADDGRGIRILSARDGQIELVYSQHLIYPRQFEFSPNGHAVASIGQDWILRLWDSYTSMDLVTGVGRHRVMRFSRDGRYLTTAPSDSELSVLELAPERVFREFAATTPEPEINSRYLVLSPDGRLLMAATPQPRLYDAWYGEEVANLDPSVSAAVRTSFFDPSGQAIYYSRPGMGIFRRAILRGIHPVTGHLTARWGEEEPAARHADTILLGTPQGGTAWLNLKDHALELWPQGDPAKSLRVGADASLESVAASENARWAATSDHDRDSVVVWDFVTGRAAATLPARKPSGLWFSPDSAWLIASVENGYTTWRASDWQPGAGWEARLDSGNPGEIAFSPDGRLVAARQEREIFRLLTFPDCREVVTLKPPMSLPVRSACFSADGSRLWFLGNGYRIFEWNLADLRAELARLGLNW